MRDGLEDLPPLEGELSVRDLLRHLIAGNLLGHVVFYNEEVADIARGEQVEPTGLARVVMTIFDHINIGVPDKDIELGANFCFFKLDEHIAEEEGTILVPMTVEDADYLLEHVPAKFLDIATPEVAT